MINRSIRVRKSKIWYRLFLVHNYDLSCIARNVSWVLETKYSQELYELNELEARSVEVRIARRHDVAAVCWKLCHAWIWLVSQRMWTCQYLLWALQALSSNLIVVGRCSNNLFSPFIDSSRGAHGRLRSARRFRGQRMMQPIHRT